MFRKAVGLIAAILFVFAFTGRLLAADCSLSGVSDTFKKITPSVVKITVFENGKYFSLGSGFFVKTPKGIKVLTAGHMIPLKPGIYVYKGQVMTNLKTFEVANFTLTVNKVSRDDDLALLDFTPSGNAFASKPLEINNHTPPAFLGDVVLIVGAPYGFFPQYTIGFTSRFVDLGDGIPYLQLSARAAPGNSGGPAVDCDGKVVGILLEIAVDKNLGQLVASFIRPGYIINQFINSK